MLAPFQFLVRDWQNFTLDDPSTPSDFASMESEMDAYLVSVIADRDALDLKETRQQISTCFSKVSSYLLPHPGIPVTKKTFDGDPSKVDPIFLSLLDRYVRRVFGNEMEPKEIQGRTLTSRELGAYVKAYSEIFKGGNEFPKVRKGGAKRVCRRADNMKRFDSYYGNIPYAINIYDMRPAIRRQSQ